MMKCIAIDDEPIALQIIQSHAVKVPFIELERCFTNGIEAMEYLQHESVDLIFLDINMPDISGIELFHSLRRKPLLIFTTAYPEYAVTGFELDAVDYLLKPFGLARFIQSCNKAYERFRYGQEDRSPDFIFIKSGTEQHRVRYSDILFLEATGNYVSFYLEDRKILSRMTMADAEKLLPARSFVRVHRSYIVQSARVEKIDRSLLFVNGQEIPVGEAYLSQVNAILSGK